jgi:phosphoribosylformimino-5-aminoimidazole carboxamide ribotide isomerase
METVFTEDPVAACLKWQKEGARLLHVVDLDVAAGNGENKGVVKEILRRVSAQVQVGGGIRSLEDAELWFGEGASRVVVGSMLFEKPDEFRRICNRFGSERVVAAIDAKDGIVRMRGWKESARIGMIDAAKKAERLGAGRLLYTCIARDGTLEGPDVDSIRELVGAVSIPIIASGGIATCKDLKAVAKAGAEAAIVGMALYKKKFTLKQVKKCLQKE